MSSIGKSMLSSSFMLTTPKTPSRPTTATQRLRRRVRRGFTLVEVMIATAVFTMGILGVYAMMIKSYELVTLARHRDNARAFLLSFSDEFLRLATTDPGPVLRRLYCTPTEGGSGGDGLHWTNPAGTTVNGDYQPSLQVNLGESGSSQVTATVTRDIRFVDSTGTPVASNTLTAAGYMLQGTFTITYQIKGRTQTQSITVARFVP